MLGRQVSSTLSRLPINARLAFRPAPLNGPSSRILTLLPQRYYATPGRPKKAVGEPSRPVKRATKRAARSTGTGEAGRQVRAKKTSGTSTASRTRKTSAKKKSTAKKSTTRRARKPLTDEQKAVKAGRIERAKITELKKVALSPPKKGRRVNAHTMLLREKTKGQTLPGSSTDRKRAFADRSKEVSREYKNLTPAEHEVSDVTDGRLTSPSIARIIFELNRLTLLMCNLALQPPRKRTHPTTTSRIQILGRITQPRDDPEG